MSKKMLNLTKNLKPMLLTTSKNILTFLCQSVLKTSVSVSALYHAGNHSITLIMVIYLSVVQVTTLPMNRKKLPILNVNYAMSKMLWMSKKSYQHSGQKLTTAIYIEVVSKMEYAASKGCTVSVSGMLKFLGVSRSGLRSFINHKPSKSEIRKNNVKDNILNYYNICV